MRFLETNLVGAWLIESEPAKDERGFFTRLFCIKEFGAQNLETHFVQHSLSFSATRGTLRGMHFQEPPHAEIKVIHCIKGAVFDVIIDIRPDSPTFLQWQGFDLTEDNLLQLYVPAGFAHGFQTRSDNAEVHYLISTLYEPSASWGLRYNDPAFAINWPLPIAVISAKDEAWPDFRPNGLVQSANNNFD